MNKHLDRIIALAERLKNRKELDDETISDYLIELSDRVHIVWDEAKENYTL